MHAARYTVGIGWARVELGDDAGEGVPGAGRQPAGVGDHARQWVQRVGVVDRCGLPAFGAQQPGDDLGQGGLGGVGQLPGRGQQCRQWLGAQADLPDSATPSIGSGFSSRKNATGTAKKSASPRSTRRVGSPRSPLSSFFR